MRITAKDVVATVLIAAIVVPYVGYLVAGDMPFIEDPRGMAGVGLVLGLAAALVAGRDAFTDEPRHRIALASGAVALALGIAALAVGTSDLLLALFIAAVVVTWGLGEYAAHRVPVLHG